MGDIGQHFPDTDPKYKGISSIALLKEVGALLEAEGYVIENIDATIIAQRPKLAAYRPQMAENIADALHLELNQVRRQPQRKDLDSPEGVRAFLPRPSRCFPICVTLRQMTAWCTGMTPTAAAAAAALGVAAAKTQNHKGKKTALNVGIQGGIT